MGAMAQALEPSWFAMLLFVFNRIIDLSCDFLLLGGDDYFTRFGFFGRSYVL